MLYNVMQIKISATKHKLKCSKKASFHKISIVYYEIIALQM